MGFGLEFKKTKYDCILKKKITNIIDTARLAETTEPPMTFGRLYRTTNIRRTYAMYYVNILYVCGVFVAAGPVGAVLFLWVFIISVSLPLPFPHIILFMYILYIYIILCG